MNSDLLLSSELLGRIVNAPVEDAVLIDSSSELTDEEMKVKVWQGFAVDFGKDLAPWDADAENVGILKFGEDGGSRLVRHLDALVTADEVNTWAPRAFRAVARQWPLRAIDADGIPWTEIDFPGDLERARALVQAVRRAA